MQTGGGERERENDTMHADLDRWSTALYEYLLSPEDCMAFEKVNHSFSLFNVNPT